MRSIELNATEFASLAAEVLGSGSRLSFRVQGDSMRPFIRPDDLVEIAPIDPSIARPGDILLYCSAGHLLLHRLVRLRPGLDGVELLIQADAACQPDGWVGQENILGRATHLQRGRRKLRLDNSWNRLTARVWMTAAPLIRRLQSRTPE